MTHGDPAKRRGSRVVFCKLHPGFGRGRSSWQASKPRTWPPHAVTPRPAPCRRALRHRLLRRCVAPRVCSHPAAQRQLHAGLHAGLSHRDVQAIRGAILMPSEPQGRIRGTTMAMPAEARLRAELCVRRHEECGADGECSRQREDGQEQRPGTPIAFRLFPSSRHPAHDSRLATCAIGARDHAFIDAQGIEVDQPPPTISPPRARRACRKWQERRGHSDEGRRGR